jgi:hypothetical protein
MLCVLCSNEHWSDRAELINFSRRPLIEERAEGNMTSRNLVTATTVLLLMMMTTVSMTMEKK